MKYLSLLIFLTLNVMCCKSKKTPIELGRQFQYEIGKEYLFEYYYTDLRGNNFLFEFKEPIQYQMDNSDDFSWDLVSPDDSLRSIDKFSFAVLGGSVNDNQIAIEYRYFQGQKKVLQSMTGLIQDKTGIWIHPPRSKGFRILELNPFPQVKFPFEKENSWEDTLQIGSQWGDSRWKTWSGNLGSVITYVDKGTQNIETQFGTLKCQKTMAEATSLLGRTTTTTFFSQEYGFVKIVYKNIDNSSITIELISIKETPVN